MEALSAIILFQIILLFSLKFYLINFFYPYFRNFSISNLNILIGNKLLNYSDYFDDFSITVLAMYSFSKCGGGFDMQVYFELPLLLWIKSYINESLKYRFNTQNTIINVSYNDSCKMYDYFIETKTGIVLNYTLHLQDGNNKADIFYFLDDISLDTNSNNIILFFFTSSAGILVLILFLDYFRYKKFTRKVKTKSEIISFFQFTKNMVKIPRKRNSVWEKTNIDNLLSTIEEIRDGK